MKRIMTGFAFRAIRTPILWILTATIIWGAVAFVLPTATDYELLADEGAHTFRNTVADNPEITAEDAYKINGFSTALHEDSVETKIKTDISDEIYYYSQARFIAVLLPDLAIVLFVTVFFGRLFTDGTVRNLVASGHSKRLIYLASVVFTIFISLFFQVISLTTMTVTLRISGWRPPIWLPLNLTVDLTYFLLTVLIASLILLLLFGTGKQIISLVVGVVLFLTLFTGSSGVIISMLIIPERDPDYAKIKEYRDSNPDKEIVLEYDMDYVTLHSEYTLKEDGEPIDTEPFYKGYNKGYVSGDTRRFMLASININPLTVHFYEFMSISYYDLYSSGRYAFAIGLDIAWIVLITSAGTFIFNKKELS